MSADDTLSERQGGSGSGRGAYVDEATGDAQMIDPAHFEDEGDDDGPDAPPPPVAKDDKYKDRPSSSQGEDSSQIAWAQNTGSNS